MRDTLEMDYPKLKSSKNYTEEAESESSPSSIHTKSNTTVRLAKDSRTLEFTTNGGMILEVNTGIKITNIFVLKEGLLLEFVAQERLSLDDIYSKIRKDKTLNTEMEEELVSQGVSYITLNYHPYDIFRPVTLQNGKNSTIWADSPMSILTVYQDASLCVAYNFLLKTHIILSLGICYEGISLTEN